MIPYFVIDQIILGPIKLYTWGLFVGLGFSAGYLCFYYLARKENLAPAKIAGLALAIFAGAMLGAKILAYVLAGGGAMFMGGLIGAIVCGVLYVLSVQLNFWRIADLLVLPTVLGIGLGRIGCILINDHQGAITSLPWGILW
ncbi:MAG: prolipoprotein diacylglyceryl transferase family protein, partial [Patescibacteria group bacterium]